MWCDKLGHVLAKFWPEKNHITWWMLPADAYSTEKFPAMFRSPPAQFDTLCENLTWGDFVHCSALVCLLHVPCLWGTSHALYRLSGPLRPSQKCAKCCFGLGGAWVLYLWTDNPGNSRTVTVNFIWSFCHQVPLKRRSPKCLLACSHLLSGRAPKYRTKGCSRYWRVILWGWLTYAPICRASLCVPLIRPQNHYLYGVFKEVGRIFTVPQKGVGKRG